MSHQISVGKVTVHILDDGHFELPSAYFAGMTDALAEQVGQTIRIGANLWLIEAGARRILVDTGSGQALKAQFPATGQSDLPDDVTDIVLTHMHADHIGGLATLPDVPVHVARAEWEFWTNPDLPDAAGEDERPMIQMIQSVAQSIADRVVLHEDQDRLVEGVRLRSLPGHTPGHQGVAITSDDESLMIIADALISAQIHFTQPEVAYALDSDALLAARTRATLLEELAQSGVMLAATHLPFPGVGRVTRDQASFRFVPA